MSLPLRRARKSRGGSALVEFALVLPIIMIFFSGLVEISRVLMLQHSADTAAYEGARHAMVPGATSAEAKQAAEELLQAAGLHTTTVTVTPETITEDTALITVQVEIPVGPNSWITPTNFASSFIADSEVTLFCERPPIVRLTGIPDLKAKKSKLKGPQPKL